MNSIFGIVSRDNHPLSPKNLKTMEATTITVWGGTYDLWSADRIGLGWSSDKSLQKVKTHMPQGVVFAAAGRVDNCVELGHLLQIPQAEIGFLKDSDILRLAYLKWGQKCSARIYGDWAYAAWHPEDRRLVLSRDQHGNTALYYYADSHTFAFATSRRALLALKLAPLQLDELYLAQNLTSWMAYHGERTLHQPICRLTPAHTLCVNKNTCTVEQYWRLEDTPELQLASRNEYAEAFRRIFDEAVRCRLRSDGTIACTLSGGLDSSSVAVTAGRLLGVDGRRLTTFTSVPFFETAPYVKTRLGDEFPHAQAVADFAKTIDINPLTSIEMSPISAIRRTLQITSDLCHGAGNLFWILDIQQAAQAKGCSVLLTGAIGNGSISWDGDIFSQPWTYIWHQLGWRKLVSAMGQRFKEQAKLSLPIELVTALRRRRMAKMGWPNNSAIHPDFARRIRLVEQMLHDPDMLPPRSPRERRSRYFMPGRSMGGAYAAEMAAAHGLSERDPTADARVLEFTFSVPDRIYMDPATGMDRWLIREAMKGRLPDQVRLNRNRGRQAGDLVPRLRACAMEVEIALNELARGPAAEYVDVTYMRQVWRMIQTDDTPEAFIKSITVLTRGIMAGLFVNQFYE
jgi:asparagine synthase (glutamine-hydrolysing)